MIGEFHKFRAGQLWNTVDERFLDPRYLPDEWDDPEKPALPTASPTRQTLNLPAVGQGRKRTGPGWVPGAATTP